MGRYSAECKIGQSWYLRREPTQVPGLLCLRLNHGTCRHLNPACTTIRLPNVQRLRDTFSTISTRCSLYSSEQRSKAKGGTEREVALLVLHYLAIRPPSTAS